MLTFSERRRIWSETKSELCQSGEFSFAWFHCFPFIILGWRHVEGSRRNLMQSFCWSIIILSEQDVSSPPHEKNDTVNSRPCGARRGQMSPSQTADALNTWFRHEAFDRNSAVSMWCLGDSGFASLRLSFYSKISRRRRQTPWPNAWRGAIPFPPLDDASGCVENCSLLCENKGFGKKSVPRGQAAIFTLRFRRWPKCDTCQGKHTALLSRRIHLTISPVPKM